MTRIGTGQYAYSRDEAVIIKMELNEAAYVRHAQAVAVLIPDLRHS